MTSKSKIALVTGGSRGLGKNMALRLAERGWDVILTYQSKKAEAEEVVNEIRSLDRKAQALQLDVSNTRNFEAFVPAFRAVLQSEFQRETFDALVNNAGAALYADFGESTEAQFDQMANLHLKAPFFLTQKLLPVMQDGGAIVNISSGLARFSLTGHEIYAAMKGGLETLTRYQAKYLGSRKIRANVVAPGAIATDFGGGAVRDNKDLNQMIASQTALGRVGQPDDIGGVVAFLCTDDAKWVNGQRIEVSGGIHL